MEYKSIIGFGYAYIISDFSAKKEALNTIVNNYTTGSFEFNEKAVNNVEIIKVEIQEISGKKSGQ